VELLVLLSVTLGVIGLAGRLPEARRVKRDLARAPIDRTATLPDGKLVTIRGTVVPIDELASPVAGLPCVYVLVVFDEVGIGGDFRELGRIEQGVPFLLDSGNRTVRVVPGVPRISIPGSHHLRRAADLADLTNFDPLVVLARTVCKTPNYPHTSALRATEYTVVSGMSITVQGWATREPDPTAADHVRADYRGEAPMRSVISGSRRAPLAIG
jgi:hypothetical protein